MDLAHGLFPVDFLGFGLGFSRVGLGSWRALFLLLSFSGVKESIREDDLFFRHVILPGPGS